MQFEIRGNLRSSKCATKGSTSLISMPWAATRTSLMPDSWRAVAIDRRSGFLTTEIAIIDFLHPLVTCDENRLPLNERSNPRSENLYAQGLHDRECVFGSSLLSLFQTSSLSFLADSQLSRVLVR